MSQEEGWDFSSEGTQDRSDVTQSITNSNNKQNAFCFSHVKGIVLSPGFGTRQTIIHQGLSCLPATFLSERGRIYADLGAGKVGKYTPIL